MFLSVSGSEQPMHVPVSPERVNKSLGYNRHVHDQRNAPAIPAKSYRNIGPSWRQGEQLSMGTRAHRDCLPYDQRGEIESVCRLDRLFASSRHRRAQMAEC